MIGTAFYVLGVIACMILIVLAGIAGVTVLIAIWPYLAGFALLAFVLWAVGSFLNTPIGQAIGQVIGFGLFVSGIIWTGWKLFPTKARRQAKAARRQAKARENQRLKEVEQHPQPGDPDYLDWANRRGKYASDASHGAGHTHAQWETADKYWEKVHYRASQQDYEEAVRWWQLAAENGHPKSQWYLGQVYNGYRNRDGAGVPSDLVQAYKWFTLGAQNMPPDEPDSAHMSRALPHVRKELAVKMTPPQIAEAERLVGEWLQQHSIAVQK